MAKNYALARAIDETGNPIKRFAELSGIPRTTISRCVYDGRVPTVHNALRISRALGRSVEELFGAMVP